MFVEVFKDSAIAIPPLNDHLARTLIEKTKVSHALKGIRGLAPCDVDGLSNVLVKLSKMVVGIAEVDMNPVLVSPSGTIALDARVLLHAEEKEKIHPVIRPYPAQYESIVDGIALRPIRPEDEPKVTQYFDSLSKDVIDGAVKESAHDFTRLRSSTVQAGPATLDRELNARNLFFGFYGTQISMLAEEAGKVIGMGVMTRAQVDRSVASFNMLVHAPGKKLGNKMVKSIVDIGRAEGLKRLMCNMTTENAAMKHLCEKNGFKLEEKDGRVTATLMF